MNKKIFAVLIILLVSIGIVGAVAISNGNIPIISSSGPVIKILTLTKVCALDLGILSCSTCTITINEGIITSTTC